ncbi:glycosyltransferase [Hyunsoonleella sp. SJ7]|uniref:Glycosyltransferase n=1 Tax=Hyunsoonleella aquatilis TaxID=2762758 RepID=A0A923HEY4_9FLAO|nr:glycosyltransferase [Hyunsoonleella aquatilis]
MRKKVLIITYYWPPAGGPGVQRWLKFVKYLPDFKVDPIVFVPENPNYPIMDKSLETEVASDLKVIKFPINEPYKFAKWFSKEKSSTISKGIISENKRQTMVEKLMLFIRGNFFIPDARVGWVNPSTEFLLKYIPENNIKTVITTGPPHSVHLIGLNLRRKLDIKWLADFRDPWTTIGYHKQLKLTKASQKKHKNLEKQVLSNTDQIIVTSTVTKKEFQGGITWQPIEVITNGYDDEVSEKAEMDSKFTLSHIGSLLSKRNPEILWNVLSELVSEVEGFKSDFQLNLVGFISDNVLQTIEKFDLTDYVDKVGYISHKESVMFQKKSQLLLLIEIDSEDTKCIIPGKLFEYMVSNRPIIAIGPKDSDVERIIKETNTGNYFDYTENDSLKKTILEHYSAYKSNTLKSHPIGLQKYHRKALTQLLSQLL